MPGKAFSRSSLAANWSRLCLFAMRLALCITTFLPCTTATIHAAIIGTGDVVPADPVTWTSNTYGYIGQTSSGAVTVDSGSILLSRYGYLGDQTSATGTATVTGAGSTWANSSSLYIGYNGTGTLLLESGGQAISSSRYLGYNSGSFGTARVTGVGSKWSNSGRLYVGYNGIGELLIEAGGQVGGSDNYLGYNSGSSGTATISGSGSSLGNGGHLLVGNYGTGILRIEAGGEVIHDFGNCSLGHFPGSSGTATITGVGSKWTNCHYFFVGLEGAGTLLIEAGGQVTSFSGYLGYSSGSSGTATVTGTGSDWTNSSSLNIGGSGSGTLNIGGSIASGGLVKAGYLSLATNSGSTGTCNIGNGGTLKTKSITRGSGTANFNWNDGTIQNYDVNNDLTIASNLILKLAATGTHAFAIDLNRIGTINAVISDATTGGTLAKRGAGALVLAAVNTYSGGTTVEEGWFKVTRSILSTSGIDVAAGATLELAKTSGSATAASLAIDNDGTVLISAGTQTVGAISGTGITKVAAGATLTAASIAQNALSIGTTTAFGTGETPVAHGGETPAAFGGAVAASMADEAAAQQVPEPGTLVLSIIGVFGAFFLARRWMR